MKIKAIDTKYNGYLFRSRAEARWAVFFDALDIKYFYELEGFDLGGLGWYLPDFYVPCIDNPEAGWAIEVKGPNIPGIEKAQFFDKYCLEPYWGVIVVGARIEYPKYTLPGDGGPNYNSTYYLLTRIDYPLTAQNKKKIDLAVEKARSYRF